MDTRKYTVQVDAAKPLSRGSRRKANADRREAKRLTRSPEYQRVRERALSAEAEVKRLKGELETANKRIESLSIEKQSA